MTNEERWQELSERLNEIEAFAHAEGKMEFDRDCVCPPRGMDVAAQDMAYIGRGLFRLTHDKEYLALLTALHEDPTGLTPVQKRVVKVAYEDYLKEKNVSEDLAFRADLASQKAHNAWLKAKEAKDFSIFRDALGDFIQVVLEVLATREDQKATPYDTLLDDYEPGGSIAQLDGFFDSLKERIVPLVKAIGASKKKIDTSFLSRPVSIPKQEAFSRRLLELEGLEKDRLVFMSTEHPFTTHFGPGDLRVTTHFYENDFISNAFSTLHEGGHALFMGNEPEEFYTNHLSDNMTNGMHECISRFYENIIGRSEAFCAYILPDMKRIAEVFDDVTPRAFYEAVNRATPSLIRTESDELTYCLHILVRYELEKALINGDIKVADVPAAWNERYKKYLGVDVRDDAAGCLQDVHWTFSFGYFPSYALGNAYGAQILHTMEKDFDVFGAVGQGDLAGVLAWLKEHVFATASMLDPDPWIRGITGESLNVNYFLNYLEKKYSELYQL